MHGDPARPEMLSLNGTICISAGGAPDASDYNQLMVVRPNGNYSLTHRVNAEMLSRVSSTSA